MPDIASHITKPSDEILISGAGPVGLLTALTLASKGASCVVLHPPAPAKNKDQVGREDQRTIALLQSSVNLLRHLNLWEECQKVSAPLKTIRICDRTGSCPPIPDTDFKASELELEALAYNVPLAPLTRIMMEAARQSDKIRFHASATKEIVTGPKSVDIQAHDGQEFHVRLAIAADGIHSPLRKAAGIGARRWTYNQTAIACQLRHSRPHFYISTEFHYPVGPCVIVPMQGHLSAIVWVEKPDRADDLLHMSEDRFCEALGEVTEGRLGKTELTGPRTTFPLGGLTADSFAKNRIALTGHAAHMIPPIGAQGLNLGFRDVAVLTDVLEEALLFDDDPGKPDLLAAYNKARRKDVLSRTFGVDLLNQSLLKSRFLPMHLVRGAGLAMLRNFPMLRRSIMRQGLGEDLDLPPMMREPDAAGF